MLYSICIPHKNDADRLSRLIKSIPVRDEIEIIVVDDHSEVSTLDTILKMCSRWKSKRNISLHSLDQNKQTAGAARNEALRYAKGKWVLFADSDDIFTEHGFNYIDHAISTYPDRVLHQFNVNARFDNGSISNRVDYSHFLIKQSKKYQDLGYQELTRSILLRVSYPYTRIIDRNWLCSAALEFEEIPVSNDVYFSCRLVIDSPSIQVHEEVIYTVTERDDSLISDKDFDHIGIRMKATHRSNNYLRQSIYADTQNVIGGYLLKMLKRDPFKTIKWIKYAFRIEDPWFYPIHRYIRIIFMAEKSEFKKRLWITLGIQDL